MKLGVVLLAAGASSRMGRPKMLLPWQGTTVLGHLLDQWALLEPACLAVVCAANNVALHAELDQLNFPAGRRIINPHPERGMFSSVQCASAWLNWPTNLTHVAVALCDQPQVRLETLRQQMQFAAKHPDAVTQPAREGRGRHPVGLPASLFAAIASTTAENLKQFLLTSGTRIERWESGDAGLDLDLDEPADYERALRLITTGAGELR
jgi:molybdenum cofactor cytidylyltransferase